MTNLIEGIVKGSIAKVENLEEVTPFSKRKSFNANRQSSLGDRAEASKRADEILKARGS